MKNYKKRFYRTGDLAKIDKNGLLQFFGRADRQIKSRGYRVELNEIENALLNIPEIDIAAVFSYKNESLGKLIGASIILKPEMFIEKSKIKAILAQSLPKYCIPEIINFTSEIKRTSAGKIDYKSLEVHINP